MTHQNSLFFEKMKNFQKIRNLQNYLTKVRFFRRRVKSIKAYLKPGIYVLQDDMLSLRNLSSLLYYDAKNHFSRTYRASIKTSIKASIRIFFCSLVVPKKGRVSINKFSGDLIRFSNKSSNEIQYGDVKIFDISSKLICTIFYSRESFESDLKKTKLMNQYFPTSEIVAVDDRKLAIYEKYVDHIEPRFFSTLDYELIQETLYNFYASYIIQQDRTGKVAHFDVKTLYNFAQLKAKYPCMEQIIELIMSPDGGMFFPHVFQHGDLSLSNILLKKDGSIVIIDWEHADYFGCFYDLHFHLLNEAIKGDFTPLEIYIRKFMNNEFELICSIVINSSAYRMGNSVIGLSLIELLMKRYIPYNYDADCENLNRIIQMIVEIRES